MDISGPSDRQPAELQPKCALNPISQLKIEILRNKSGRSPQQTATFDGMLEEIALYEAGPVSARHVTSDVFAFVLDTLSTPIVIVDRHLDVLFANAAANAALANSGILRRSGQQLSVVCEQSRSFSEAVLAASSGFPIQRTMILEGSHGRSIAVWLRPIDGALQTSASLWSRGLVCVSFRMLRSRPAISRSLLIQHYSLTPKQAELACRLALGASISVVAADMKIKITTLRSHLSRVYHKTGTRQQSDLVSLMLSLTSPVQE